MTDNTSDQTYTNDDIDKLIQDRIKARNNKDFTLADSIRIELNNMGIEIEDTQQGTKWRKK